MDAIHRSEEISLAQIYLQNEAAYNCVAEMGELGLVQFRDLNADVSPFQRKYVAEIRRCDEMERKLRYLEREIKRDDIPILDTGESPEAPQPREMSDLEATFEKLEHELREVNQNEEMLKKNFVELTELKHILRKTQTFFEEGDAESQVFSELDMTDHAEPTSQLMAAFRYVFTTDSKNSTETERQALDSLNAEESPSHDNARLIQDRGDGTNAKAHLKFVAGIIQRDHLVGFDRLLWHACRGNVFLRQAEITESLSDASGNTVNKVVFIIFFQGDQLKSRVKKICEAYHATLYPCPDTPQERREMSIGVMTRIEDLKTVLGQTQDHRHRVLVAAAKNVRLWMAKVRKIKSIYYTLNMCNVDLTQKCLVAEVWFPKLEEDRIRISLKRGSDESGSTVAPIFHVMQNVKEKHPTYNRTNKFTRSFQNIVDAYGIASYREINPAPYTIITFPFLFAIMFGDFGHGTIMMLFGLFLILREKQLEAARIRDDIFQTFFGGRYVIFLMGCFSIYTGIIYNDAFSKSFNLFGSAWSNSINEKTLHDLISSGGEKILTLEPNVSYDGSPYPIGVDPIWNLADTNKLNFLNSMKMKASVLIGISQMTFGLGLSYYNHKFFQSRLDIIYVFIPQMLFLTSIFIYLCFQIVVKWIAYDYAGGYTKFGYYYPGAGCAPALLIGLINMFMMKDREKGFVVDNTQGSHEYLGACHTNFWYPGQSFFETIFLLIALACIPVMLFAKPYFLWKENQMRTANGHAQLKTVELILLLIALTMIPIMLFVKPLLLRRAHKRRNLARPASREELLSILTDEDSSVRADVNEDDAQVYHYEDTSDKPAGHGHGHGEEFNFGDIMVYQAIHTIEFALGCISHTASYLRLWALSLAHAQLSDVLWSMVFRHAFELDGYVGAIATFVLFFIFAFLTLAILVLMEGLSAFLHALRLHWVEFQSKFYAGDGYVFNPFSFEKILEDARNTEDTQ
uniref:V-type proton ATPase subunit a n=1 Tax=Panagrellus redivivus TaxID=6233 RepID=A0A7E4W0V1_PANRE